MISGASRPTRRGDEGVALVLVLVFVAVLGVLTMGQLALTDVNSKVTQVARARTDALYTADGAADFTLEQIRTTATSACPPTIAAPPATNGITPSVSVTCSGGSSSGNGSILLGAYSAIALGPSGISAGGSIQSGDNLTVKFLGDVYSGGSVDALPGTGNSLIVQGNAALAGSSCPFNTTTDPQVTGSCLANQAVPAVAQTSPEVVVPSTAALAPVTSGSCTILYPGSYTSAPTFSSTQGYYLASGTYYFNGTGGVSLTGWIKGGAVGASTAVLSGTFTSRCSAAYATDANAKAQSGHSGYNYTGSGVALVLGGNTTLNFPDSVDTKVELFPRVPAGGSPDLLATSGVSVWGQMGSAGDRGTSGVTGSYSVMTQSGAFSTQNDTLASVVTQGLTWLPDSAVVTTPFSNAAAGAVGQLKGGVVADSLSLWGNNISGGVTSSIAGGSTTTNAIRTVTLTAVAAPAGAGPVTLKVVATFPTTANGYPTILSWRKV